MEFTILDSNLNPIYPLEVVDINGSIIWADRYSKVGDFELYTPVNNGLIQNLIEDRYISSQNSEHVMVIENLRIISDPDQGPIFKVTGRSLESILDRRIIWNATSLTGNFQLAIKKILDENIIAASDVRRRIPNFQFITSTDPAITSLTINEYFHGEEVYETIKFLCESKGIGFRIKLESQTLKFELYSGVDRSFDQQQNSFVVFSPDFDNLVNSDYIYSDRNLKNAALVRGSGSTISSVLKTLDEGLNRREVLINAPNLNSTALLESRGISDLTKREIVETFGGQIQFLNPYKYREDFFVGDIVSLTNEYGTKRKVRIIDVITSRGSLNTTVIPLFKTL